MPTVAEVKKMQPRLTGMLDQVSRAMHEDRTRLISNHSDDLDELGLWTGASYPVKHTTLSWALRTLVSMGVLEKATYRATLWYGSSEAIKALTGE